METPTGVVTTGTDTLQRELDRYEMCRRVARSVIVGGDWEDVAHELWLRRSYCRGEALKRWYRIVGNARRAEVPLEIVVELEMEPQVEDRGIESREFAEVVRGLLPAREWEVLWGVCNGKTIAEVGQKRYYQIVDTVRYQLGLDREY